MPKTKLSKILWEDLMEIFKVSKYQLCLVSVLIGVLLFLLNAFLGVGLYAGQYSNTLKDRLGMYFYVLDVPGRESETYTEIMTMKDELQAKGLDILFSSKEDALKFLEKKIPNVVGNFQKYGIDNPLPATLYVMFRNNSQYEDLKSVILKHKNIILNIKDINPDASQGLQQQENRSLTFINFSNFIQVFSWSIIALLTLIILTFVGFFLHTIFDRFINDFKIKKILGAGSEQITTGFVWLTCGVVLGAFVLCAVLLSITGVIVNIYLIKLFGISLFQAIGGIGVLGLIYLLQVVVVTAIALIFSYFYVYRLNKNV